MDNNRKSAANVSKQPSAGARPKATKGNIWPRSSTATRPILAPKPSQTHASSNGANNSEMGTSGAKEAKMAALIAGLRY